MKILTSLCLLCSVALPVAAEGTRQLDAHEHGVGTLNIAIDGVEIAMELAAPGVDIVGFEHPAVSDADRAAIAAAIDVLSHPLELFVLPERAGCNLIEAHVALEGDEHADHEDHHDAHDHDKHDDHDDHDDHDAHKGEHDHAEHKHDDHDHDAHETAEKDHDDHDHHEDEANHTEFHAEYRLACKDPTAIDMIDFAYFAKFPNALELKVQVVNASGARAFEVERDDAQLTTKGLF